MTIIPSPFQVDIYDFVETGAGNLVINAVAGSGKTTTIIEAIKLIPPGQSIIFIAFNKEIVKELALKCPTYVDVKTVHSVGYSIVRYNMGNVIVKNDKILEIIKQLYDDWDIEEHAKDGYMIRVNRLVDLAKLNLATNLDSLYAIAEHHNVDVLDGEVEKAWLVYNLALNFKKSIDMTDTIFLPAHHKMKCKQYDWVLVDEGQDLNKCQQQILQMLVKPTGRFIVVGDPRQAIYGFAGASAASFDEMRSLPNTITLPLSVNYRCPKSVIALAQPMVPQLQAFDGAIEGKVVYDGKWKNIQDGDYVLCRNVKPLIKLCMDLLIDGKKAGVRGRDIGTNLINMLHHTHETDVDKAIVKMNSEAERTVKRAKAKGKNEDEYRDSALHRSLMDKIEAIETLASNLILVEHVINKIKSLFTDDKSGIVLSTIHKAKGLEANNVWILNQELMPSKYAKKDWEKEQETNLIYVAYTRAKKQLLFIDDYDGTNSNK